MSVTEAKGFRAAGVAAGLKTTGARDVALVVNDGPLYVSAGVFTSNRIQAAPVKWSRERVGTSRAVLLNSGGANACTGEGGERDVLDSVLHVSDLLEVPANDVLVCSTGLIGVRLPLEKVFAGASAAHAALADTPDAGREAAQAIMTTDTVHKTTSVTLANGVTVGGMAKGAGMLAPQLATMLVVLTTDAVVTPEEAQRALAEATSTTFDRVDSDACMSTNDSVILLASGASGVSLPAEELAEALREVSARLARALVADAEGASHDVHVVVTGAASVPAALAVAREIARSNLVKAAIFGNDPNWGRIVAAAGCVSEKDSPFSPNALSVRVNGVSVCHDGAADADPATVDMTPRECLIEVDLGYGDASGDIWTNDLTHDYVEENSAYSS
ncbi:bifunctional glutamate N-acetyltransferase/amino-acid acetyltransferase ArgJ [Dermabacteraceae bacterium TAE3-ERU27]|nr:bifunctional glutamate N-acetyltransferase/amino-acid acetyltransferase ArgJ [Dermabacteraceae bacterium TAE3-ERU27]